MEPFTSLNFIRLKLRIKKTKQSNLFRSDRGGEYFSKEFDNFCEEHGIIHQKSTLFTPQQKGLAKRKNRIFTNMINSMLLNAKLSACHVHNRITSMKIHVSPYEI